MAWNALGHKTVCEIAWRELAPEKRQAIVDTLRRHPRFDEDFAKRMPAEVDGADKATQDHWIFQHAGYWPDIARGIKGADRAQYDRPTWHYVNGPIYLDRSDRQALAKSLTVNISDKYPTTLDESKWNVLQAIKHCQAVLRDKRTLPAERAVAYCWLFHLVGDSHQPLHSCALFSANRFPKGDRGGNDIPLAQGDNLHALWDGLLGRQYYMRNVDRAANDLDAREKFGDVWDSAGKETNPRRWVAESYKLASSFAYADEIKDVVRRATPQQPLEKITLPRVYLQEAGHQARRRVLAAGLRLAAILDEHVEASPSRAPATDETTTAPPISRSYPMPASSLVLTPAAEPEAALTHWLNTGTGQRHNSSCRWYGKTKGGRYCTADEGDPCGQCGG